MRQLNSKNNGLLLLISLIQPLELFPVFCRARMSMIGMDSILKKLGQTFSILNIMHVKITYL